MRGRIEIQTRLFCHKLPKFATICHNGKGMEKGKRKKKGKGGRLFPGGARGRHKKKLLVDDKGSTLVLTGAK